MPLASVSRCPSCKAVVNVQWRSCLVCQKVLVHESGPLLAVKIVNSVIGDYWLILDETEPFAPGDGLPIYRPSEMKALLRKGYGSEALQALHRAKIILDGKIVA